ncbi:hypothetical protein Daesc_004091 [Daldinia eschscholtzii]|uniref:Nudix hydrolase domain-containing protein n=1 Tax=Daldinia eschscholtzii TaxID=292717 RepID=A0AAX6MND3_9PEZI
MSVLCNRGCTHSAPYGAAGLLVYRYSSSGKVEILLGQQEGSTQYGFTWDTTWRRQDLYRTVDDRMRQQVLEKTGLDLKQCVWPTRKLTNDHGGWVHTTFLAQPKDGFEISDLNLDAETRINMEWVTRNELDNKDLEPTFKTFVENSLDHILPPDRHDLLLSLYG